VWLKFNNSRLHLHLVWAINEHTKERVALEGFAEGEENRRRGKGGPKIKRLEGRIFPDHF